MATLIDASSNPLIRILHRSHVLETDLDYAVSLYLRKQDLARVIHG